jgi:CheY-like chemotaxis protein
MDMPQPTGRPVATRAVPICVLVVDDSAISRELAAVLLDCWGARAVEASNGAEAVALVGGGHDFDIVLMDIQMPVLNGLEATARIREIERERARVNQRRLPIVAFTSEDMPADEVQLQQLGLDAVLTKPLTAEKLMACLEQWCPNTFQPN